jgi:tight adherence protein B
VNAPYALLGLFVAVAALLFLVLRLLLGLGGRRPRSAEEGPTLIERAAATKPPRDWEGRVDRNFDRMVRWTLLDVTSAQALGYIILAGVVLGCLGYFLSGEWWLGGLGLLVGMLVALAVFLVLQGRWRRAVQDQLPEGLFLLARSLRAGLSLEQAFASSREFCPRPLSEVFGRIADQVELGTPADEAVHRMAEATRLADLQALASVLALHRQVGGNLPELLDRLAVAVRDRNQFRGFYRAATALSRISAAFVAIAAPVLALIIYLDQPELFLNFFRSSLGVFLFTLAIVLDVVGIIWLTLLVRRVEY